MSINDSEDLLGMHEYEPVFVASQDPYNYVLIFIGSQNILIILIKTDSPVWVHCKILVAMFGILGEEHSFLSCLQTVQDTVEHVCIMNLVSFDEYWYSFLIVCLAKTDMLFHAILSIFDTRGYHCSPWKVSRR